LEEEVIVSDRARIHFFISLSLRNLILLIKRVILISSSSKHRISLPAQITFSEAQPMKTIQHSSQLRLYLIIILEIHIQIAITLTLSSVVLTKHILKRTKVSRIRRFLKQRCSQENNISQYPPSTNSETMNSACKMQLLCLREILFLP